MRLVNELAIGTKDHLVQVEYAFIDDPNEIPLEQMSALAESVRRFLSQKRPQSILLHCSIDNYVQQNPENQVIESTVVNPGAIELVPAPSLKGLRDLNLRDLLILFLLLLISNTAIDIIRKF